MPAKTEGHPTRPFSGSVNPRARPVRDKRRSKEVGKFRRLRLHRQPPPLRPASTRKLHPTMCVAGDFTGRLPPRVARPLHDPRRIRLSVPRLGNDTSTTNGTGSAVGSGRAPGLGLSRGRPLRRRGWCETQPLALFTGMTASNDQVQEFA